MTQSDVYAKSFRIIGNIDESFFLKGGTHDDGNGAIALGELEKMPLKFSGSRGLLRNTRSSCNGYAFGALWVCPRALTCFASLLLTELTLFERTVKNGVVQQPLSIFMICTAEKFRKRVHCKGMRSFSRPLKKGNLRRQRKNPDILCMSNTPRCQDFFASLQLTFFERPVNLEFFNRLLGSDFA